MERIEAIQKLKELIGIDLYTLAPKYGVTVRSTDGTVNKGWAGHICERYLGLPLNSAQSPNFGSWELKSIPLHYLKSGSLAIKETMAITMIDEWNVRETPFENSHLLSKLRKAVIVARIVNGEPNNFSTTVHSVTAINLEGTLYNEVKDDYDTVRCCLKDPTRGFQALTGAMGKHIQPRTKGRGHGTSSRAFYARKSFLSAFIAI